MCAYVRICKDMLCQSLENSIVDRLFQHSRVGNIVCLYENCCRYMLSSYFYIYGWSQSGSEAELMDTVFD